ncbi:hypothetical protein ACHAQK_006999 [Fusarium lateritium]
MASPSETKPYDHRAKDAEYQALWQCCDRTCRKAIYVSASDQESKRAVLHEACEELMNRRREQGKVQCGTSVNAMVDLHLQREINNRILVEARLGHLPSSSPNPVAYGNPNPFMANSVPPQQPSSELDFTPHGESNALIEELKHQQAFNQKLVNTLRTHDARIRGLEAKVLQLQHDLARTATYRPQPMYYHSAEYPEQDRARTVGHGPQPMFNHGSEYPAEGIEGLNGSRDAAYTQQRPLTPSSHTNGNDGYDVHRGIGL